jgi:signal transduction histidine kinase
MRQRLTRRRSSATPAFRRSRARAAPTPDEVAPQAPDGLLFAGMRRTLGVVLERLNQNSRRIVGVWRRLLRHLDASNDGSATLASLDLAACYRHLSLGGRRGTAAGDEAYRLAVERGTRTLLRAGVPEDHAIAAIALYLEACLRYLERPAETRALIRLTSATQGLVAAGYCEERVAGLRRLDDRERQKLSGDLHDEVGADLVVLKLYVEMIAVELEKVGAAPVGPKLQEALALIAHAIESVRRLTLDLGPAFLDALGFLPALRGFVRQFSLRTGIKVQLEEADAPISMPVSHETALYRVLRGALSNVAKHSTARHVRVSLDGGADVFVMTVEDDGKGFDVRAQAPDHTVGLAAMRERIRGLRGRLSVESWVALKRGEKSGTRIEVRLPLRRRTAA